MRIHRVMFAVALAAVVSQLSYAEKKYGPGVTDTEIKIGSTNPYSGPASAYGIIGRAESAYFKMINDQGGINGRKINFISLDDGYSPPRTVEQVRKLVEQEQVLFLAGTLGTPPNSAIHKYVNAKRRAAHLRQHRRHQVGRPEELPLDHGFQPQLPGRGPHLRKLHPGDQARRQDRHPLPERRLRQRLRQGPEGRAWRQGRKDGRGRGQLRGDRSDDRFADRHPARPRARILSTTSPRPSSPPRRSARSTTWAGGRCTFSTTCPIRSARY